MRTSYISPNLDLNRREVKQRSGRERTSHLGPQNVSATACLDYYVRPFGEEATSRLGFASLIFVFFFFSFPEKLARNGF